MPVSIILFFALSTVFDQCFARGDGFWKVHSAAILVPMDIATAAPSPLAVKLLIVVNVELYSMMIHAPRCIGRAHGGGNGHGQLVVPLTTKLAIANHDVKPA